MCSEMLNGYRTIKGRNRVGDLRLCSRFARTEMDCQGPKRTERDKQGSKFLGFFCKLLILLGQYRPFTSATGVQIPLGTPNKALISQGS